MSQTSVGVKILRRIESVIDRPLSLCQVALLPIDVQGYVPFRERLVLKDFGWLIHPETRVIYDIGANMGDYASAFSRVKTVEKVIAFEPLPDVFQKLSMRSSSNKKILCINSALGNESGLKEMHRNEFHASSSFLGTTPLLSHLFPYASDTTQLPVPIERLDDLVASLSLPSPDLVKIDVQGFEGEVLAGGTRTIGAAKYCVIEVNLVQLYEGMATAAMVLNRMSELGFGVAGFIDQLQVAPNESPISVDIVFANRVLIR